MIRQSYSGYPGVWVDSPQRHVCSMTGCSRADSGRWICGTIIRGSTGTGLGRPDTRPSPTPQVERYRGYW